MLVDNYMVFYLLDELKGIVVIVRIMYGGRDVKSQLNSPENKPL